MPVHLNCIAEKKFNKKEMALQRLMSECIQCEFYINCVSDGELTAKI